MTSCPVGAIFSSKPQKVTREEERRKLDEYVEGLRTAEWRRPYGTLLQIILAHPQEATALIDKPSPHLGFESAAHEVR